MRENQLVAWKEQDGMLVFTVKHCAEELKLPLARVHEKVKERAAVFGLAQVRIVDRAAKKREKADGSVKSEKELCLEKWESMRDLIAHYASGSPEWEMPRGEQKSGGYALQLFAYAEIKGQSEAEAEAALAKRAAEKGTSREEWLAYLAQGERMQRKMLEIRMRRAGPPKADADAMLDEM